MGATVTVESAIGELSHEIIELSPYVVEMIGIQLTRWNTLSEHDYVLDLVSLCFLIFRNSDTIQVITGIHIDTHTVKG